MKTIKDPIRQASLFTPFGLIDPRLMPGYKEEKVSLKKVNQHTKVSWLEFMLKIFKSKFGFL